VKSTGLAVLQKEAHIETGERGNEFRIGTPAGEEKDAAGAKTQKQKAAL